MDTTGTPVANISINFYKPEHPEMDHPARLEARGITELTHGETLGALAGAVSSFVREMMDQDPTLDKDQIAVGFIGMLAAHLEDL